MRKDEDLIKDLVELGNQIPDVIEFAGGYINTPTGVRQERGAGPHFNRNAGKYIGTGTGGIIGLGIGALVDRSRRKKNKIKTSLEPSIPEGRTGDLAKGPVFRIDTAQ